MIVRTTTTAFARQIQPRVSKKGPWGVVDHEGGREEITIDGVHGFAEVSDFIVKYPDGLIEVVKAKDFAQRFTDEDGEKIVLDEATSLIKTGTCEVESVPVITTPAEFGEAFEKIKHVGDPSAPKAKRTRKLKPVSIDAPKE